MIFDVCVYVCVSTPTNQPPNTHTHTKQICDSALTAVANGEMGLTVHAGGEFEAGNKYYDPYQFTSLVVAMAAKARWCRVGVKGL